MRGFIPGYRVPGTDHHPHPVILGKLFQAEQGSIRGHTRNRAASD